MELGHGEIVVLDHGIFLMTVLLLQLPLDKWFHLSPGYRAKIEGDQPPPSRSINRGTWFSPLKKIDKEEAEEGDDEDDEDCTVLYCTCGASKKCCLLVKNYQFYHRDLLSFRGKIGHN